ncbi:MAG: phospho-sugar mutase [Pseudomonadota bacterium]|nr:phospho-sugar mutase [Pseudomonadota bacterium]
MPVATPDTERTLTDAKAAFEALPVRPEVRAAALANLRRWLESDEFAPYLPQIRSLEARGRWDVLLDSFYQVLPFGTGGRRGPVGIGPNRYNPWTLGASVQGHVAFLRELRGAAPDRGPLHVVIAYDVRCYRDANGVYDPALPNPCLGLTSRDFAEIAAGVYAENGVVTTLLAPGSTTYVSTPELSFAIRHLAADGGLNVSASHNPPDDNGGKFYNARGGQEVPPNDERMAAHVDRVERVRGMPFAAARAAGLVRDYSPAIHEAYVAVNVATSLRPDARSAKVVFTGLHGTGDTTVVDVLRSAGFQVEVEPTQAPHDGAFPEVPFRTPNPEVRQSMDRAVKLATERGADLVMACDPDADRIGLCARGPAGFRFFTGNEIAVLVAEYRLSQVTWLNPIVMQTEVTTDLVRRVAVRHGAQVVTDLMVGFKYIGDGLGQLEDTGRFATVTGRPEDMVVGVEESHGVLVTSAIRDKDAAGAALALAEYASLLSHDGRTLTDALETIWAREGYVHNELVSTVMRGAAGKARIDRIQASMRENPPTEIGKWRVLEVLDRADPSGPLGPIKSGTDAASRDVLVFRLAEPGGSEPTARLILRPSGTEPKNKIYVEVVGRPGVPAATEIPRVSGEAKALALAFAEGMLARVGIELPLWALRVSDLVAIEYKQHLAEVLLPEVRRRIAAGAPLDGLVDEGLRPYGKDPRGLVADAVRAWADQNADEGVKVREAFGA